MDIHMQPGNTVVLGESRYRLGSVGDGSAEFSSDGGQSQQVALGNGHLAVDGYRVPVEPGTEEANPVLLRVPSKLYAQLERT